MPIGRIHVLLLWVKALFQSLAVISSHRAGSFWAVAWKKIKIAGHKTRKKTVIFFIDNQF
jgi:hypothetical protein